MRIPVLFLIKHMDTGGGEFVFYSVISGLPKDRFEPILVCLTHKGFYGKKLAEAGIIVYDHVLHGQLDVGVVPRLVGIIRKHQVQVVYLMDYRDTMLWGPLAARWAGIPSILASHSPSWWNIQSITLIGLQLMNWNAKVIVVGECQRRYLLEKNLVPAEKIVLIPNGVDYEKFAGSYPRPADLPPPEPHFLIGTVSALRPGKNVDVLLRAVQRLDQAGRQVRVWIVGDGPERPKFEACARELKVDHLVSFLGSRSDIHCVVPLLDVFVLTSIFEITPISIIEAMCARRPVISTNAGSVDQVIDEGETGFLIPMGDDRALEDRLIRLMDHPELREKMGQNATKRAEEKYVMGKMINENVRVIEEAIRGFSI